MLPKQVINVVPAGRRCRRDERRVRTQPADPAVRLRPGAADRMRQRRQPAAGARGGAPRANRRAPGHRRLAAGRSSCRRSPKASCSPLAAASPDLLVAIAAARLLLALAFRTRTFLPISTAPSLLVLGFAFRIGAGDRNYLRRGARVVRHAHRSGRSLARIGPQHQRSFVFRPQGAAGRAGHPVGRAGRGRHHAGAQPRTSSSIRISDTRFTAACWLRCNIRPATYTQPQLAALYRQLEDRLNRSARSAGCRAGALQSAHRQLGRTDYGGRPSCAQDERRMRARPGTA